jgi:hypothetical protein
MKYFFEIENWQKYFGFIFKQGSILSRKQCFHHIHAPYAPDRLPTADMYSYVVNL